MSREARYAVYLVDPGANRPGVLVLIGEVLGLAPEAAATYLEEYPSLISFFETEAAARNLADRFRDFDAIAVVRPAHQPLAPAPVERVDTTTVLPWVRVLLLGLAGLQLWISYVWFRDGRWAAAFFGVCLAVYVLLYFGRRTR